MYKKIYYRFKSLPDIAETLHDDLKSIRDAQNDKMSINNNEVINYE